MNGWMGLWMVDNLIGLWVGGWIGGWMDEWIDGWGVDGWMGGWKPIGHTSKPHHIDYGNPMGFSWNTHVFSMAILKNTRENPMYWPWVSMDFP